MDIMNTWRNPGIPYEFCFINRYTNEVHLLYLPHQNKLFKLSLQHLDVGEDE